MIKKVQFSPGLSGANKLRYRSSPNEGINKRLFEKINDLLNDNRNKKLTFLRCLDYIQANGKSVPDAIKKILMAMGCSEDIFEQLIEYAEHTGKELLFSNPFYTTSIKNLIRDLDIPDTMEKKPNLTGPLDFSGLDLTNLNLENIDLQGANLERCILQGTDLSNAKLNGANLQYSYCYGVKFTHANLNSANLSEARVFQTTFDSAQLVGTDFTGAKLDYIKFKDCTLKNTRFENASLLGASFEKAELSDVHFDFSNCLKSILQIFEMINTVSDMEVKKSIAMALIKNLTDNKIEIPKEHFLKYFDFFMKLKYSDEELFSIFEFIKSIILFVIDYTNQYPKEFCAHTSFNFYRIIFKMKVEEILILKNSTFIHQLVYSMQNSKNAEIQALGLSLKEEYFKNLPEKIKEKVKIYLEDILALSEEEMNDYFILVSENGSEVLIIPNEYYEVRFLQKQPPPSSMIDYSWTSNYVVEIKKSDSSENNYSFITPKEDIKLLGEKFPLIGIEFARCEKLNIFPGIIKSLVSNSEISSFGETFQQLFLKVLSGKDLKGVKLISSEDNTKLLKIFSSWIKKSSESSLDSLAFDALNIKLDDKFSDDLLKLFQIKSGNIKDKCILFIALAAFFSMISSKNVFGNDTESPTAFRNLAIACINKSLQLKPDFEANLLKATKMNLAGVPQSIHGNFSNTAHTSIIPTVVECSLEIFDQLKQICGRYTEIYSLVIPLHW